MAFDLGSIGAGIGRGILALGTGGISEIGRKETSEVGEVLARTGNNPGEAVTELAKLGTPTALEYAKKIMESTPETPASIREFQMVSQMPADQQTAFSNFKNPLTAYQQAQIANDKDRLALDKDKVVIDKNKEAREGQKLQRETQVEKINNTAAASDYLNNVKDTVMVLDDAINQLRTSPKVAGASGWLASWAPGTAATDFMEKLTTVKSNIGFDKLQKMRDNSTTGSSGLGQLAVKEMEGLQATLGSLNQKQSPKQLLDNLTKVRNAMVNSSQRVRSKFDTLYPELANSGKTAKEEPPAAGAGATGGQQVKAPVIGAVLDGYEFMGGNPADQKNWKKK